MKAAKEHRRSETLGGVSAKFLIMCGNADAACEKAIAAGAMQVTPLTAQFYSHRDSRVRDPFGHEWLLSQKVEDVSPEEMQRRWDAMAKK